MSSVDRRKLEEGVRELAEQLNELREAIQVAQNRVLAISSELDELRLAFETLNTIEKYGGQREALLALDRRGYAYVKASISVSDKAIVHIGQDLYVLIPLDKAKNVLASRERDLITALREAEAEFRKLNELYLQLQRKLQEYVTALSQQGSQPTAG